MKCLANEKRSLSQQWGPFERAIFNGNMPLRTGDDNKLMNNFRKCIVNLGLLCWMSTWMGIEIVEELRNSVRWNRWWLNVYCLPRVCVSIKHTQTHTPILRGKWRVVRGFNSHMDHLTLHIITSLELAKLSFPVGGSSGKLEMAIAFGEDIKWFSFVLFSSRTRWANSSFTFIQFSIYLLRFARAKMCITFPERINPKTFHRIQCNLSEDGECTAWRCDGNQTKWKPGDDHFGGIIGREVEDHRQDIWAIPKFSMNPIVAHSFPNHGWDHQPPRRVPNWFDNISNSFRFNSSVIISRQTAGAST